MPKTKRLFVPTCGGKLSKGRGPAPKSWSGALRQDLHAVCSWLAGRGLEEAMKLERSVRHISGREEGFRYGSRILVLLWGIECSCKSLPHDKGCDIWKKHEFRDHFQKVYGITPYTKTPPDPETAEGETRVIPFPRTG